MKGGLGAYLYRSDYVAHRSPIAADETMVYVVNIDGPGLFHDRPPVMIESHCPGMLRAVPCGPDGLQLPGQWAAGGRYVAASDSRFREAVERMIYRSLGGHGQRVPFYGAVALHDYPIHLEGVQDT